MRSQRVPEGHIGEQRAQMLRIVRGMHRKAASFAEESVAGSYDPVVINFYHHLMDDLERYVWWAQGLQDAPPPGQQELPF